VSKGSLSARSFCESILFLHLKVQKEAQLTTSESAFRCKKRFWCTSVTFQRKTYFTFHRRPKRRRQTGPFRAKLTCKCPLIVYAMTYNYFLKLHFFSQATLYEIRIFLFFLKVFTFQ